MQDAIVRVILGIVGAGVVLALLVPLMAGRMPEWTAWVVILTCVACALLVGRKKGSLPSRT